MKIFLENGKGCGNVACMVKYATTYKQTRNMLEVYERSTINHIRTYMSENSNI